MLSKYAEFVQLRLFLGFDIVSTSLASLCPNASNAVGVGTASHNPQLGPELVNAVGDAGARGRLGDRGSRMQYGPSAARS